MRVAITGVSGYIGIQLLRRLEQHPQVETVVGLDVRPPEGEFKKLQFYLHDVGKPMEAVFRAEGIDSAVHLAFIVYPTRRTDWAARVNLRGTLNFIDACRQTRVEHAVYLGSTTAYGAHADNAVLLTEESPLRPNVGFQYSQDKAETDAAFQALEASTVGPTVTLFRGCVVLGPGGARSIGAKLFQPIMIRIAGFDPLVQYVHEEDLVELLVLALERRPRGIYNVAGDGAMAYSDVARLAKRVMVAVPRVALAGAMRATWALGLQSGSPSAGLDFIMHPWVASNQRLKSETGFTFRYSSDKAVEAYLRRRRS